MSGDSPVIKFSPFEALLIGEHNNIIKRKPMKNTIYLSNLNNRRKEFNLRELFDVKEDVKDWKQQKKVKTIQRRIENEPNFNSLKAKQRQKMKQEKKSKKGQSNKVRFKPEFRFRETLEERIVQKIQKRKKKFKTNLVGNGVLCQLRKPNPNRHSLRGKNGQFIRREDHEKSETKTLSNYLKNLYVIKSEETVKAEPVSQGDVSDRSKYYTESVLNDISLQYYRNVFPEEFGLPVLPEKFETTDFEQDNDLKGILDESNKNDDDDDGDEDDGGDDDRDDSSPSGTDIEWRRKGLKMYERKKTDKNEILVFEKNSKENHFVNNSTKSNNLLKNNSKITHKKRKGVTCLIDERPAKSNHLIWNNKFRSLFYKTAFGSEMYLGNLTKAIVLNSTFGRLPDIS